MFYLERPFTSEIDAIPRQEDGEGLFNIQDLTIKKNDLSKKSEIANDKGSTFSDSQNSLSEENSSLTKGRNKDGYFDSLVLKAHRKHKYLKILKVYKDTVIDETFDNFLKGCELGKIINLPSDQESYRKVCCRGEIYEAFKKVVSIIYCKKHDMRIPASFLEVNLEQLGQDGRRIIDDIAKFFKKSCLALNKLEFSNDSDVDTLKSTILLKHLNFFIELAKKKGWSLDDTLDGVSATYSCIKNFNDEKEYFLETIRLFQEFYSKLIPFSELSQLKSYEQNHKRWKITKINDGEIYISDYKRQHVISAEEWGIWLKTLASKYLLFNIGKKEDILLKDLSYLYCDMMMTPNRSGTYLAHSDVIQLFSQYCHYLEEQSLQSRQSGTPLYLFSEQEVTDYDRRKRIVRSILDGRWYENLDRVTDISPEDLLYQKLVAVDRNPRCNFTIGELLAQVYPDAICNGELSKDFTVKKLFELGIVIDSIDGRSKNNGYYHTSRYLIKSNTPQTFRGVKFEAIEIRIHGADRFSNISNTNFLPCVKLTLTRDEGIPLFKYCFFSKGEDSKSGWYKVEEVTNDIYLLAASHLLFTPAEDIFGNEN